MKRDSLKLQELDWAALTRLAESTGSVYAGKPSWRCLVRRIAQGELKLAVGDRNVRTADSGPWSVRRNVLVPKSAPCPCGSGRKFCQCCGRS